MILPKLPQTSEAVAAHYDELDPFYRDVWGDHIHHGYWATGRESTREATEALVDLVADRLRLAPGQRACDIGCGYGATAGRLAARHRLHVTGVTLSAAQATRGAAVVTAHGSVTVRQQDWLANGFAEDSFDRAYAIESSEHMPDKQRFFDECFRTLRPGGLLVVCAWLARSDPRPWQIRHLLEPICREGRLAGMADEADYRRFGECAGFRVLAVEDLSERVRRTWWLCARRLLSKLVAQPRYIRFLLDRTASDRRFAITPVRLLIAYQTGSMRYGLLLFQKPAGAAVGSAADRRQGLPLKG